MKPLCKICRREGKKLFLKGKRCYTSKCAMVKKNYPPGVQNKTRRRISEYGSQLREKQKLKRIYNVRERQFKKYFKRASQKKGMTAELLLRLLESRLDNIIYRLGLCSSRGQARQLVSHGHFLIDGRAVNIPSCQLKIGDIITLKKNFLKSNFFKTLKPKLKEQKLPSWLAFNKKKMEAKIKSEPSPKECDPGLDLSMIIEFYSR